MLTRKEQVDEMAACINDAGEAIEEEYGALEIPLKYMLNPIAVLAVAFFEYRAARKERDGDGK